MYNFYDNLLTVTEAPSPEAAGEGSGDGSIISQINFGTIIFSIINMIILFLILRAILFKPVSQMLHARTESIKKNIDDAKKDKVDAESLKAEYQTRLSKANEEATAIIGSARQKAEVQAQDIISNAKKEADIIVSKAKEQVEREVETALDDVKNQIASLAFQAASKVIQKNMDTEDNRKLVEEFLNEVGVA